MSILEIKKLTSFMFPNADFEVRKKDPDFVKGHHQTFFNDGYPFLLTSQIITPAENEIQFYSFGESSLSICISDFQESLVELNNHTKEPIPMNRFRPRYWIFNVFWSTAIILFHNIFYLSFCLDQYWDLGASLCSILVEGCEPFSEDLWTEIKISKFTFFGVRLCYRCKVKSFNL